MTQRSGAETASYSQVFRLAGRLLPIAGAVMLLWQIPAATPTAGLDISRYTVMRTLGPIKVDGVFDEPSWRAAKSTGAFRANDGSQTPTSKVEAKMIWDDSNLYFAFECEDTDLFATMTKRDEHLWQE